MTLALLTLSLVVGRPRHVGHKHRDGRAKALAKDQDSALASRSTGPSMTFALQRPQIILYGDSLTERGFSPGGWAAGLAHLYARKADVVNRGFGGYNSRWLCQFLGDVFKGVTGENTLLVTLFLGANDAALPDGPRASAQQHVPVEEYVSCLKAMVAHVRGLGVQRLLLITPPPVHERGRREWSLQKANVAAPVDTDWASIPLDRSNAAAGRYTDALVLLAGELQLPCLNLHQAMQLEPDWQTSLLCDGLHLSALGNQFVFEAVRAQLAASFPDVHPTKLPLHLPAWDQLAPYPAAELAIVLANMREQGERAAGTLVPP